MRAATANRKTSWTVPELEASLPVLLQAQPSWKVTSSPVPAPAPAPVAAVPASAAPIPQPQQPAFALTTQGWSFPPAVQTGAWLQVELPEPAMLTEIQFNVAGGGRGGAPAGRGGAVIAAPGRGGAPAGAPVPPAAGGAAAPPPPAPTPAARGGQAAAPAANAPAGARGAAQAASAAAPVAPPSRVYKVEVSLDGVKWGTKPVADNVAGGATPVVIAFAPVRAKFVRLTQTSVAEGLPAWALSTLRLYQPGAGAGSGK